MSFGRRVCRLSVFLFQNIQLVEVRNRRKDRAGLGPFLRLLVFPLFAYFPFRSSGTLCLCRSGVSLSLPLEFVAPSAIYQLNFRMRIRAGTKLAPLVF